MANIPTNMNSMSFKGQRHKIFIDYADMVSAWWLTLWTPCHLVVDYVDTTMTTRTRLEKL